MIVIVKVAMRGYGYMDQATNEVAAALSVLAKYGSLGVGLTHTSGTHSTPLLGVTSLEQSVPTGNFFGAIGQVNLDSYIGTTSPSPRQSMDRYDPATAFDVFRHTAGQQTVTPISINTNSYGLATNSTINAATPAQSLGSMSKSPTPADLGSRDTKSLEISESIVGAILGK